MIQLGDLLLHPSADFRVKQLLERTATLKIAEDQITQLSAIQAARLVEHLAPEFIHDSVQRGFPRLDHLASNDVCVYDGNAQLFKTS